MNFRKSLYGLTQEELMQQIEDELRSEGIKYKKDEKGGVWSILHKDKPCFVSHLDTVIYDELDYRKPITIEDGIVSRPGYVLGADDRAGVNIILNHKHKINFCLTLDEEIGAIGANSLARNNEFIEDCDNITFFCELDRMASNDCISYSHGYSNKELSDEFIRLGFKDTRGVFTDIDAFTSIAQGVNISVGYYKQHTTSEYLVLEEFDYVNSLIPEINNITVEKTVVYKPNYDKCDMCGRYYDWWELDNGMCEDCYIDIQHECCICHRLIPKNESYYTADGLELYFCEDCLH